MHERPQLKILFLVFGLCLIFLSPIIIVFGPMFFPITFHYEKNTWVYYTPTIDFYLYGGGIVLLIIACFAMLIWYGRKWAVVISSLFAIVSLVLFVGGSMGYMKMNNDGIKFQQPFKFEQQTYRWSDIDRVIYYSLHERDAGRPYFEVYFNDGEMYKFSETEDVKIARSSMQMMIRRNGVIMEYVDLSNYEQLYDFE